MDNFEHKPNATIRLVRDRNSFFAWHAYQEYNNVAFPASQLCIFQVQVDLPALWFKLVLVLPARHTGTTRHYHLFRDFSNSMSLQHDSRQTLALSSPAVLRCVDSFTYID